MFGNVYHRLFTSVNGTKNMKANCFLYLYSLHFSLSYGVSGVITGYELFLTLVLSHLLDHLVSLRSN